jgi:hypothetical protein
LNDSKTETIFDKCRRLEAENARLRMECETRKYRATVIADIAFEAKYEAMRKVADAAVAINICHDAARHVGSDRSARDVFYEAEDEAYRAMQEAVREYRGLTGPPPLEQETENDARRD